MGNSSVSHILSQLQLLAFVALAFALSVKLRFFPQAARGLLLDTDWIYRRPLSAILGGMRYLVSGSWRFAARVTTGRVDRFIAGVYRAHGPQGPLARTWPTGSMVLWIAVLLGMTLVLTYI